MSTKAWWVVTAFAIMSGAFSSLSINGIPPLPSATATQLAVMFGIFAVTTAIQGATVAIVQAIRQSK